MFKTSQANKKAESVMTLKELPDNESLILEISTKKSDYGVRTIASVCVYRRENGYSMRTFTVFQDYMKVVLRHDIKRVTDKAIENAHALGLSAFESGEFMSQIKQQYGV